MDDVKRDFGVQFVLKILLAFYICNYIAGAVAFPEAWTEFGEAFLFGVIPLIWHPWWASTISPLFLCLNLLFTVYTIVFIYLYVVANQEKRNRIGIFYVFFGELGYGIIYLVLRNSLGILDSDLIGRGDTVFMLNSIFLFFLIFWYLVFRPMDKASLTRANANEASLESQGEKES